MTTTQWVVLVAAIIVVLAVIGMLVRMGRGRKIEADRAKASELHEEGDRSRLQASEHEANAASADAKARQARVEAEKLQREADARSQDAQESRNRAEKHYQRATELDPDSDGPSVGDPTGQREQEGPSADGDRH
mgnify:CR=1 FL=1